MDSNRRLATKSVGSDPVGRRFSFLTFDFLIFGSAGASNDIGPVKQVGVLVSRNLGKWVN